MLIERESQLRALEQAAAGSWEAGRVVLLSGEAGHGKTSLLDVFLSGLDHRYRVLVTACEPVGIPAAFAPLFDLLAELPATLASDIRSGAGRPAVYTGMLDALKNERVVLVIEDIHWADEATLGLVRYLGRRIGYTSSTLVVTYRPEEIDVTPPLRLVIADLGPLAVRIDVPPLSLEGVARMTEGLGLDPGRVHAATLGNPFFVEEVVRHPEPSVPPTVENAILARAAQLPPEAAELLYMVALSPEGLDLDIVTSVPDAVGHLDMAVTRRLLASTGGRVACRHDLIRESLLNALPPLLGRSLHLRLLAALELETQSAVDAARLAYHSVGAGDSERAARYSLRAARDAAVAGAHRQAVFHYANALEHGDTMEPEALSEVLLDAAKENCLINAFEVAATLAAKRVHLSRGEVERARARAWLAFFLSRENDLDACLAQARLSIEVLRAMPPSPEIALSLAVVAWVEMVRGNREEAVGHADEAGSIARSVGARDIEVSAEVTGGTARALLRDPAGWPQVERAAQLAVDEDLGEFAARALNNLGLLSLWRGRPREALAAFGRMIEYSVAHEIDSWYIAGLGTRAALNLSLGRWDEADADLEIVLGQRTCRQTEIETLVTAATLRARRGDPGAIEMIEQALQRIDGSGDHEAEVMGCALQLEAAWIGLFPPERAEECYRRLGLAPAISSDTSGRGMLGYWASRLGLVPPEGRIPGPAGMEWAGDVAAAARSWEERGFVVEAAITRAMLPHPDLDEVFSTLARLGAHGVIRGLRRELERRGVKRVPRGERASTRTNPSGLTPRQVEVLSCLVSGMSNADIARELFISEKTASHHVSAILAKLNVSSRLQAARLADLNGWLDRARETGN